MRISIIMASVFLFSSMSPAQEVPKGESSASAYEQTQLSSGRLDLRFAAATPKDANPPEPAFVSSGLLGSGTRLEDHGFFDKASSRRFAANLVLQTGALLSIQSHGGGGKQWCESRGRTVDPFEKHFESYGYGWGATYRYSVLTVFPYALSYAFHKSGHHRIERWIQYGPLLHAGASIGYALQGSRTIGRHY